MKTYHKKLKDIKQDAHNLNQHTERGTYMTRESVGKFGARMAGVLDANGVIIDGNDRQVAYGELGLEEIQVIKADPNKPVYLQFDDLDLSDPTNPARELQIALHRSAVTSFDLDLEMLQLHVDSGLDLGDWFHDFELEDLGFDLPGDEKPTEGDTEPQIDKAAELQKKWQVQTGDMFAIGPHRLICGDCTDAAVVERVMGGERADAVVTDPPYGQNQPGVPGDDAEFHRGLMLGCVSNLPIDNGIVVAFQSTRYFPNLLDALCVNNFNFECMLWMYKAAQVAYPWRGWIRISESILVASVGDCHWNEVKPYSHDCYYLSELSEKTSGFSSDLGWHGSVKPLTVISDIVSRVCYEGDVVYDPFSGSGTTMVSCEKSRRICRAVEIEPSYVAVTLERMLQAFGLEGKRIEN